MSCGSEVTGDLTSFLVELGHQKPINVGMKMSRGQSVGRSKHKTTPGGSLAGKGRSRGSRAGGMCGVLMWRAVTG